MNTDAERKATEIRLRAERRAGELLRDTEKAKAGRPPKHRSHDTTELHRGSPTLSDMGISKDQSSRWQLEATVPEERFEQKVATAPRCFSYLREALAQPVP